MKETYGTIEYKDKTYKLFFNLNVMEQIQEEYETVEKWGELTSTGEVNAKALIFGFTAMLNEGIDIDNEENGTDLKPFTHKQVGRIITDLGLEKAADTMKKAVVDSTESAEKNA